MVKMEILYKVCLVFAIIGAINWGLIGLFLLEKLHPRVENLIQKINAKVSKNAQGFCVAIFVITIIVDTVFSTIRYLG